MSMLLALMLVTSATPEATTQQPEAAKPAKRKLICESSREMGSLTRVDRVCLTKEQWDQRRRDSADSLEARQRAVHVEQQ